MLRQPGTFFSRAPSFISWLTHAPVGGAGVLRLTRCALNDIYSGASVWMSAFPWQSPVVPHSQLTASPHTRRAVRDVGLRRAGRLKPGAVGAARAAHPAGRESRQLRHLPGLLRLAGLRLLPGGAQLRGLPGAGGDECVRLRFCGVSAQQTRIASSPCDARLTRAAAVASHPFGPAAAPWAAPGANNPYFFGMASSTPVWPGGTPPPGYSLSLQSGSQAVADFSALRSHHMRHLRRPLTQTRTHLFSPQSTPPNGRSATLTRGRGRRTRCRRPRF